MDKDRLEQLLWYDKIDGHFYWKVSRPNGVKPGDRAGSVDKRGYWRISIDGKYYKAHRLVFLIFDLPVPKLIDHINGIKIDNRLENLRCASPSENQINRYGSTIKNKLQIRNVHQKANGKFVVQISHNGSQKYIGTYDFLELANLVACEARSKYHGVFNRKEAINATTH